MERMRRKPLSLLSSFVVRRWNGCQTRRFSASPVTPNSTLSETVFGNQIPSCDINFHLHRSMKLNASIHSAVNRTADTSSSPSQSRSHHQNKKVPLLTEEWLSHFLLNQRELFSQSRRGDGILLSILVKCIEHEQFELALKIWFISTNPKLCHVYRRSPEFYFHLIQGPLSYLFESINDRDELTQLFEQTMQSSILTRDAAVKLPSSLIDMDSDINNGNNNKVKVSRLRMFLTMIETCVISQSMNTCDQIHFQTQHLNVTLSVILRIITYEQNRDHLNHSENANTSNNDDDMIMVNGDDDNDDDLNVFESFYERFAILFGHCSSDLETHLICAEIYLAFEKRRMVFLIKSQFITLERHLQCILQSYEQRRNDEIQSLNAISEEQCLRVSEILLKWVESSLDSGIPERRVKVLDLLTSHTETVRSLMSKTQIQLLSHLLRSQNNP